MVLQVLGLLALAYLIWSLVALEINYYRASAMGIPRIRVCVDGSNLLWQFSESHVWRLLDLLGLELGSFRYTRRGWTTLDKAETHIRLGPAWALVSPRRIYVYIVDSEAVNDIFQRRSDFLRPTEAYKILEVYGPCISTASAENWPRHRKVMATPFNENAMSFVWDESIKQSEQMVKAWASQIPRVAKDTRTVSLNVIAAIGFRKSYSFRSANEAQQEDSQDPANYRDALQMVLDHCIMLMVIPRKWLSLPFAPSSWHKVAKASERFQQHMTRMLDEEVKALNEGKAGSGSMMTSFVRAMDLNQKTGAESKGHDTPMKGLSVDEIFGNIFVINFAGHDTTANTLAFAIMLLAAYPDVQSWVTEELRQITPEQMQGCYTELFPKLKRCQAILHETLRMFAPVYVLQKKVGDQPQSIKLGEKTVIFPPKTFVFANIAAAHAYPKYWDEPDKWNPSRWVKPSGNGDLSDESLIAPARCTYFPWAEGPQNCPGIKFSQVEFVAVMARLLRDHRISAVPNPGETAQQLRTRVLAVTHDVNMQMLVRMKDADRVRVACRRI
ncbi:cytochrome P450 monooxygenase [Penicillium malachiteum]|uniref:Cytochrome P450 monooxygenase n=1 Tax=Penicillium malachiteum TaxID=1324776 RepID=A0AAD6HRU2_9EURO|nr:cytochrome P450 monooxygenase [Penicillium malachiteum]